MLSRDGTGHVAISVEQVGEEIELIVADDGIGMQVTPAAKIPEKRGSNYVAIFVRQLGGTNTTTSSREKGTEVKIRLPLLVRPSDGTKTLAA